MIMKTPYKKVAIISLILILLGSLMVYLLPIFLYVPPKIDSIYIVKQTGPNSIEISVKLINQASISANVKEGDIIIFNEEGKIGEIKVGEIEIPAGKPTPLNVTLKVITGSAFNRLLSELLTNGNSSFYYEGDIKVAVPVFSFLTINLHIPKEKAKFELESIQSFVSVDKIIIPKNNDAKAIIILNNPTNLGITLTSMKGNIYYNNKNIGSLNYSGPIELGPHDYNRLIVNAYIETDGISGAINDLVNNKTIVLTWKGEVALLFGDIQASFNATINKNINFDFDMQAKVNNIKFLEETKLLINSNVTFSLSDNFDLFFKIKQLLFTVYSGNERLGIGYLSNIDVIGEKLNNITLILDLNKESLPSLISLFFSGQSITLDILNVNGTIEIFNKDIMIHSDRRISIPVDYQSLGINFEIKVTNIQVSPDNNNLNVTLKFLVKAPNVSKLNLFLLNPSFVIYEPQTNSTLKIKSSSLLLSDETYSNVSILLNVNDPSTSKIFSLFATQGKVKFYIKSMNATLKVGNTYLPVNLRVSQDIEVTPLGLVGVRVYAGFITAPSLGIFKITLNVTIDLKSDFPIQLYIYQVTYDVYSSDGSVLIAKNATLQPRQYENVIPIVILVGSGSKTFVANANVTITEEGLRWIAQQALQNDFLNLTVKNITVYLKLFSLPLKLYIASYTIKAELFPRLIIKISQFNFYPGKKAEVEAQLYSPNYQIPVNILSLKFKLNDGNTFTYFANGSLLSVYSNVNGSLLNGKFLINFVSQNPLTYIGALIKGADTLLYGSDVNVVANLGGKEVNIFLFRTVFLRVSSLIEIETNATLKGFSVYPSSQGINIIGEGLLNVTLKQGINAPVNFKNAKFIVMANYMNSWKAIGSGELITQGTFTGKFASLNIKASVSLNKEGFAYFGQNLLSSGLVIVRLSNITMHVSIYDIEGDIPFVDVDLPITGPNLSVSISNIVVQNIDWGLSGTSVVVRSVTVQADVTFKNPYNFTVTLSNIKVDVYHSSGAFLGRAIISQTITLGPNQSVTIQGVTVTITNVNPLYSNLSYSIINLFPLQVKACITGLMVYAKGSATTTVYDVTFLTNFVTPKIPVPQTCAILS